MPSRASHHSIRSPALRRLKAWTASMSGCPHAGTRCPQTPASTPSTRPCHQRPTAQTPRAAPAAPATSSEDGMKRSVARRRPAPSLIPARLHTQQRSAHTGGTSHSLVFGYAFKILVLVSLLSYCRFTFLKRQASTGLDLTPHHSMSDRTTERGTVPS